MLLPIKKHDSTPFIKASDVKTFIQHAQQFFPSCIRYCSNNKALGALIVRGMVQSAPNMRLATIVGMGMAGICSWFNGGLVLSVLVSIVAAFLILQL
jgi:hypothetical protein